MEPKALIETLEKSAFFVSDNIYAYLPSKMPSAKKIKAAKVIAHRGVFDNKTVFENSMESIESSLGKNIYGVELDIRWTKDLVPVVFHDETTERVFGSPEYISELSWNEIQEKYPLIPSLKNIINQFGGKTHFMFELKCDPNCAKKARIGLKNQFKKLYEILAPLKPIEDFHFMSFETALFEYLEDFPSETFIPIAQLNFMGSLSEAKQKHYGGLACHYLLVSSYYRKLAQFKRLPLGIGFIDSINNFKIQCNNKVEWMFTNQPLLLSNFIEYHSRKSR